MSLRALFYAYIIGGITFIPLLIVGIVSYAIYTSAPNAPLEVKDVQDDNEDSCKKKTDADDAQGYCLVDTYDAPRTRKGWLTVRRTFEESPNDTGYVTIMRSFLDARTKDPKRVRPKDMLYVVLKGTVLYLYEDEEMTECGAAVELSGYDVIVYPEGLLDGELFARRNAICLRAKVPGAESEAEDPEGKLDRGRASSRRKEKERDKTVESGTKGNAAGEEASKLANTWFIFVRSNIEMEDWYLSLIHASEHPAQTPTLGPLQPIFQPADMDYLVSTLDEQPDVIPMRWFNALIGRIFFSYYRTHALEAVIIGKLMKKLSKVKRPAFLSDIVVTEVSLGNKAPTLSKPMLKELTKEGDASLEVHARYKGEVRITVEATATINLSTRLKPYAVKLVLAAILREIEGNMLIKVKRPPSNRIWYGFTQMPRIVLDVEPVVSDRQITWGMILSTIESRLKEIIQESVVLPNMDDIAFFESSPYRRRGGIWEDASRRQKGTSEANYPASPHVSETKVQDASVSVRNGITAPTADEAEVEPLGLLLSGSSAPSDTRHSLPISTTEASPDNRTTSSRPRSWLSGMRNEAPSVSVAQSFDNDEDQAVIESERSRASERTQDSSSSVRSSRSRDTKVTSDVEDGMNSQPLLFSKEPGRPSSQHSLHNNHASVHSGDSATADQVDGPVPRRRLSDAASSISTSSSPPTASSFLSTLRSKDKQAIKDSAKEAMRKLGSINWGIRKEWTTSSVGKEPAQDHLQTTKEGSSGVMKASYADLRAAVTERRQREKTTPTGVTDISGTQTTEDRPSDVPGIVINDKHSSAAGSSESLQPTPLTNRSAPEIDEAIEGKQYTPILVQPQGKTMTIPGIHASHRGEVMALGYVAPSTPPDNKTRNNPNINTFYRRLMKSPTITSQDISTVEDVGIPHPVSPDPTEAIAPSLPALELQPRPMPPPLPPRSIPLSAIDSPNLPVSSDQTITSEVSKAVVPLEDDLAPSTGLESSTTSLGDVGDPDNESSSVSADMRNERLEIKPSLTFSTSPPPLPPRRVQTSV